MKVGTGKSLMPNELIMLETRKLSEKTRHFSVWGKLSWSPLVLVALILLFCISMILGMIWPSAERDQSRKNQEYQDVKNVLQDLPKYLDHSRLIDRVFVEDLHAQQLRLEKCKEALSLKSDTRSARDPQTLLGRVNIIVDDLRILQSAYSLSENQKNLVEILVIAKEKVVVKRYPDGSAAKGFQWASLNWIDAQRTIPSSITITWKTLEDGKPLWQHMIGQLAAVEMDLQSSQDVARRQAAKDLWDLLNTQKQLDLLRQTDAMYSQILLSKERLTVSLKNLPQPVLEEVGVNQIWQRLIFSGSQLHGLMLMSMSLGILFIVLLVHQLGHRKGMQKLAENWLQWAVSQEVKIRKTAPILEGLKTSTSRMTDGLDVLVDRLKHTSRAAQEQDEEESLAQTWHGLQKLKIDIYQEVQMTREKLLNVHAQFCSGATRENLIYDMAYIAQALETIESSVQTLSRHLDLINKKSTDSAALSAHEMFVRWSTEIQDFKRQFQSMFKDLEAVESLVELVVEDVPQAIRFDAMPRYDA